MPQSRAVPLEGSHVEPEENHVSVRHHIFLPLGAHQSFFLGRGHGAAGDQIVIGHHLCPDEAPFEIGVDLPRRLRRPGAPAMVQARTSVGPAVR